MTDFGDFDFGFSAASEDELVIESDREQSIEDLSDRLQVMYNAILPLLNNLRKDPEKQYIVWPDRTAKIDAFEAKLTAILNGEKI